MHLISEDNLYQSFLLQFIEAPKAACSCCIKMRQKQSLVGSK